MILFIIFFSLLFIFFNKKDRELKYDKEFIIDFILTGVIYISLIELLVEKGLIKESFVSGRGNPIGILLYFITYIPVYIGIQVIKKIKKCRKKKNKKSTQRHIVREYREKIPKLENVIVLEILDYQKAQFINGGTIKGIFRLLTNYLTCI